MKILVVSLQSFNGRHLQFSHDLVDIERESEGSFRVKRASVTENKKYIRKDVIDKVIVESNGPDIIAKVWALNESESLSTDLLRYWKHEVKSALLNHIRMQNAFLKKIYNQANSI